MKKALIILGMLLAVVIVSPAQTSFKVSPGLSYTGFCLAVSGSNAGSYVPIATGANSSLLAVAPTPYVTLFGFDGTNYDTVSCDSSGNLIINSLPQNATDPATCAVAQVEFNTTSHAPKYCYPANTWNTWTGGGGSFTALTGDATSTSTGGATTVVGANNVTSTGTTGTGEFVFSISPALTGTPDASGATQFKLPVAASFTTAANGEIGYDSSAHIWHLWVNGADDPLGTGAFVPSLSLLKGTYTDGDWCSYTASGTVLHCDNAASPAAQQLCLQHTWCLVNSRGRMRLQRGHTHSLGLSRFLSRAEL